MGRESQFVLMYNDIHNIVAFHAEVNNEYEKV